MKEKIFLSSIFLAVFVFHSYVFSQAAWFQQNSGINQPISKIVFIDENTGWCSSSGGVMFSTMGFFIKTSNGGQNWLTIIQSGVAYASFDFIDYNTGWLIGGFANDIGQRSRNIYKTINGGSNWQSQLIDSARGILQSVSFVNSNYGLVVGTTILKGLILRTTNSGINWIIDSLSTVNFLYDVYYSNISAAWAVGGSNGQIIFTTNGGLNWVQQFSSTGITLYDIFFINGQTGWAGGTNGIIVKTTNAGNNWTALNVGVNTAIQEIMFVTLDTGFASGGIYLGPGYVFKTTNGGLNGALSLQQSSYNFNSVYFINNSTGWVAGGVANPLYIGVIYKTTTGGISAIKPVSNEIPADFNLSQNYPNPFNPVTTITFNIPSLIRRGAGVVVLKIYDILGKETATLVNEELKPGTYEVRWDASNFSSGVYFYSLQTAEITKTKKMILVK